MKVRLFSLATAVGLSVAPVHAEQPTRSKVEPPATRVVKNQDLADAVATQLRASGLAAGASIHIATTTGGVVELSGKVSSPEHGTKVLKKVMEVSGVTKIESTLEVAGGTLTRVAASSPVEAMTQPLTPMPAPIPSFNPMMGAPNGMMPMMVGNPVGGPLPTEPAPVAAPNFPVYDPNGPSLPQNAWPTYAPYPNASRIGYPEAYPYNAFPYIGPYYPFPKVPLGWRSVKLEWEDGHWYYGRISTPHDYWRVRFW